MITFLLVAIAGLGIFSVTMCLIMCVMWGFEYLEDWKREKQNEAPE